MFAPWKEERLNVRFGAEIGIDRSPSTDQSSLASNPNILLTCYSTYPPQENFRNYSDDAQEGIVMDTYRAINTQQTVAFVREQHEKWGRLDNMEMRMFEVLDMLQHFGMVDLL